MQLRLTQIKPLEDSYTIDDNGCWLWTEGLDKDGYGTISGEFEDGRKRKAKAHRVFYEKYVGPIPEGHGVLHHCDVRCCVCPDHLWTGTAKDNHDDMVRKGRRVEPMAGRKQPPHVGAAVAESNRRRAQAQGAGGRFVKSPSPPPG